MPGKVDDAGPCAPSIKLFQSLVQGCELSQAALGLFIGIFKLPMEGPACLCRLFALPSYLASRISRSTAAPSLCMLRFDMKSWAPDLMAATEMSSPTAPATMMNGRSRPISCNLFQSGGGVELGHGMVTQDYVPTLFPENVAHRLFGVNPLERRALRNRMMTEDETFLIEAGLRSLKMILITTPLVK